MKISISTFHLYLLQDLKSPLLQVHSYSPSYTKIGQFKLENPSSSKQFLEVFSRSKIRENEAMCNTAVKVRAGDSQQHE